MSERYKILSAICSLKTFTIPAVVELTGVSAETVRSVVSRGSGWFEVIGTIETKKRGGQHNRYQVRPNALALLEEELTDEYKRIYAALQFFPAELREKAPVDASDSVAVGTRDQNEGDRHLATTLDQTVWDAPLLEAEEALCTRMAGARTTKERQGLLDIALMTLAAFRNEVDTAVSVTGQSAVPPAVLSRLCALEATSRLVAEDLRSDTGYRPDWKVATDAMKAIVALAPIARAFVSKLADTLIARAVGWRPRPPISSAYAHACALIDDASLADAGDRFGLLDRAEEMLACTQEEGCVGGSGVQGYISFQRGRAALVRREFAKAAAAASTARSRFVEADDADMLRRADRLALLVEILRRFGRAVGALGAGCAITPCDAANGFSDTRDPIMTRAASPALHVSAHGSPLIDKPWFSSASAVSSIIVASVSEAETKDVAPARMGAASPVELLRAIVRQLFTERQAALGASAGRAADATGEIVAFLDDPDLALVAAACDAMRDVLATPSIVEQALNVRAPELSPWLRASDNNFAAPVLFAPGGLGMAVA